MKTDREWAQLIVDADIIGDKHEGAMEVAELIVKKIRAETLTKLPTIEMCSESSTPLKDSFICEKTHIPSHD